MVKVGSVELTDEEVREFREVFDLVDKGKGGTIDAAEVKELMVGGLLRNNARSCCEWSSTLYYNCTCMVRWYNTTSLL